MTDFAPELFASDFPDLGHESFALKRRSVNAAIVRLVSISKYNNVSNDDTININDDDDDDDDNNSHNIGSNKLHQSDRITKKVNRSPPEKLVQHEFIL